jgi:hypothetical protein
MSNSRAIAAVTATLRNVLIQGFNDDNDLPGVDVTTRPLDKARNGNTGNQLNIFLYHTTLNTAFANMTMPTHVPSSSTTPTPLPLNLYYLITAYGEGDDDVKGHLLLGRAMGVLHDNAALDREVIRNALNSEGLTQPSNLHEQIDRVYVTLQPVSLDEMSKLWTTFQTEYRISTAYHASVVLIESERPAWSPLPVTRRGSEDDYVQSQADLTPPFLTLTSAILTDYMPSGSARNVPPHLRRTSFIPGDSITLQGYHLQGDVRLRLEHARLANPIELDLGTNNHDQQIVFTLPTPPTGWIPGVYNLTALIAGTPERTSNTLALPVAPVMTLNAPPDVNGIPTLPVAAGIVSLTVGVSPSVRRDQHVVLLATGREFDPLAFPPGGPDDVFGQIVFELNIPAREQPYPLRLRVGGVDSLLIDYTVKPPVFREDQLLKVT